MSMGWATRSQPGKSVTRKCGCLSLSKNQTLSASAPGKTASSRSSSQPSKSADVRVPGQYVYVSNRNDEMFGAQQDSLATYSIGPDGSITFVESTPAHAWYPRTFAINKAGNMVAVGGQTSANVAVIARNPAIGRLGDLLATLPVGIKGTDGGEDGLSDVVWNE